ncbi:general stress protein [Mycobacterium hubeiense]|uniref:general stress protein n=1 Tax=Mycobacterium hubeiense TaxID=1867256 RepID=UPI000C7F0C31|nr:general stress protein [Mycobacterium sp. QGD 101]
MTDHSTHPTTSTPDGRVASPARQVIATFDKYADAERAVDRLSDQGFAVSRVAIVGRDLQLVEQVLGRLNYGTAALRGAVPGGLVGALIGWIFGVFSWVEPLIGGLVLAGYGLVIGAVIGAVVDMVVHALQRGRRDFHAVSGLVPQHYDVVADVEVSSQAMRLLHNENQ